MKTAFFILGMVLMLCGCKPEEKPAEPIHWEYAQIEIDPPGGNYKSEIIIMPARDKKIWISDCADAMNEVTKYGWQEVWISGDGTQLLVRRPYGGESGSIISTEEL